MSVISGFFNALCGGGGLITLPALIMIGIPPIQAVATNKLQGMVGTATATWVLLRRKQIIWHDIKSFIPAAFLGSFLGTLLLQFIDTQFLSFLIPLVLLVTGIYFLIPIRVQKEHFSRSLSPKIYRFCIIPMIGGYDGMFGPGTGSFFALSEAAGRQVELFKSIANAKALNFATNVASFFVFIFTDHLLWTLGLLMMVGQAIGAWLGSHCLLRIHLGYLRLLIVGVCFSLLYNYLYS